MNALLNKAFETDVDFECKVQAVVEKHKGELVELHKKEYGWLAWISAGKKTFKVQKVNGEVTVYVFHQSYKWMVAKKCIRKVGEFLEIKKKHLQATGAQSQFTESKNRVNTINDFQYNIQNNVIQLCK